MIDEYTGKKIVSPLDFSPTKDQKRKLKYSDEFKSIVKATWPEEKSIHSALDDGSMEVSTFLFNQTKSLDRIMFLLMNEIGSNMKAEDQ